MSNLGPEPTVERFFFLPNKSLAVWDPEEKKLVIAEEITNVHTLVVSTEPVGIKKGKVKGGGAAGKRGGISPEIVAKIHKLHAKGMKPPAIAKELGISVGIVYAKIRGMK